MVTTCHLQHALRKNVHKSLKGLYPPHMFAHFLSTDTPYPPKRPVRLKKDYTNETDENRNNKIRSLLLDSLEKEQKLKCAKATLPQKKREKLVEEAIKIPLHSSKEIEMSPDNLKMGGR